MSGCPRRSRGRCGEACAGGHPRSAAGARPRWLTCTFSFPASLGADLKVAFGRDAASRRRRKTIPAVPDGAARRGKLRRWRPSSPTWPARASARPSTSMPRRGRTTSPERRRSGSRTCAPTWPSAPAPTWSPSARRADTRACAGRGSRSRPSATWRRWGDPYRPTCAARRWSEPSGTIVHRVLGELGAERRVILWNTVPTHPHRPGEPLSNRRPAVAEVEAGAEFARRLIALVRPGTVVAVGRIAESVLGDGGHVRAPPGQRRRRGVCRRGCARSSAGGEQRPLERVVERLAPAATSSSSRARPAAYSASSTRWSVEM